MAEEKQKQAAAKAAANPVIQVTLDEFCARLSSSVKPPELLGGFELVERVAGRTQDTEDAYKSRFAAFVNMPA